MKICHVCNFECEENAELCPICGADLTNQPEESEQVEEKVVIEPVLLGTLEDVVSAEIFKDILIDNKIAYSCDDEGGKRNAKVPIATHEEAGLTFKLKRNSTGRVTI